MPTTTPSRSLLSRFLTLVERGGNALPHPGTLFAGMAALVVVASAIAANTGLVAVHPGTGAEVRPLNLLSIPGLHRMLTEMVSNFTGFAPLGTVLVAMLGIAIAEGSGLIGAALKLVVLSAPRSLLTPAIVFAGVMSNTGGEVGYVLLVPLAAVIFAGVGRHPIAGLAAAFAGVSGGYSANLLLGTLDPLLAGLSEEAARIIDPAYTVNPAANYYFMATSTFVITAAGTAVTEWIVEPRLGGWRGGSGDDQIATTLAPAERRGLRFTAIGAVVLAGLLLWGTVPENGFLRDPATGSLLRSPFMSGIVALIFISGAWLGLAYGFGAGTIRSDRDVMQAMGKAMETLGIYLVLVFFMAQFVAYFNWTNLGLILAVKGAGVLQALNLGTIPLMIAFVVLSATINLFMGSASAKWAVMAPVFIPMLMILGYTPEFTQAAYRVGDSVTNIISPMMSYFALIVAFMQRYDSRAGMGTIVATMLPYSVTFLAVWTVLLIVWVGFGIPVGPGADLRLQP
jgi:aminobenzoyl-glutamate transport protein